MRIWTDFSLETPRIFTMVLVPGPPTDSKFIEGMSFNASATEKYGRPTSASREMMVSEVGEGVLELAGRRRGIRKQVRKVTQRREVFKRSDYRLTEKGLTVRIESFPSFVFWSLLGSKTRFPVAPPVPSSITNTY